jgi:hypothetical protein
LYDRVQPDNNLSFSLQSSFSQLPFKVSLD